MSFLVYIVFVDERYSVTALFTSLRAAEASSSRVDLAGEGTTSCSVTKNEQAVSGVGNKANDRQLDQLKMDASRSKLSAILS